jgi:hypothetical protein
LINRALPLAANNVSVLILDAIPCMDQGRKREDQETTENESIFHFPYPTPAFTWMAVIVAPEEPKREGRALWVGLLPSTTARCP